VTAGFEPVAPDLPGESPGRFPRPGAGWRAGYPGFRLVRDDRAVVRSLRTFARRRALEVAIPAPLQLHGQHDGCIAPVPADLDRPWFTARDPRMAARVAACLA
jgi:hypothetical protein